MGPESTIHAATSIYSFQKNPTMVDYPGRLAALFFVSGCNFRCGYCHNAGLLAARRTGMSYDRLEAACEKFRDDWVDGVVISGGEPTLAPDLPVLIGLFKSYGFRVKIDTNGSRPEVIARILREVDYIAMDIKCSLPKYPEWTGFPDMARVQRSIDLIKCDARDYEFRTTVIEPFHTDDEIRAIGELALGCRRLVLQPFVPRDDLPDEALRGVPRTSPDRMKQVAALLRGCAGEVVCRE